MKKKIEETMRFSIFEVFEKMFYIFLEPLDDESTEYDMEAAIRFEGFLSGKIRILFSMDIAKTMIQNMLGLKEDEITTQRMEDCSKEAVNMICGNFLGKLDSTKVFNLTMPSFRMETASIEPGKNACRMNFDSDEGKIGVIFDADGRV
ncbi:chemotaxis protein CheX [Desulfobacula sp.]|uniref:chemotaxis protein CheX n=1 Tax=Desulfobacula sp. TaxID=2593537 RepID=UPI00261B5021|nr:chemotaxis protein CheX [Desulfobacula sp.]